MKKRIDLKGAVDELRRKDAEYEYVMDDICENNRRLTVILCTICAVIFAILLILGFAQIGVRRRIFPFSSWPLPMQWVFCCCCGLAQSRAMELP